MQVSKWIWQYNISQVVESFIYFNKELIMNISNADREIMSKVLQGNNVHDVKDVIITKDDVLTLGTARLLMDHEPSR